MGLPHKADQITLSNSFPAHLQAGKGLWMCGQVCSSHTVAAQEKGADVRWDGPGQEEPAACDGQATFGPGSRWLAILFYFGLTRKHVKGLVNAGLYSTALGKASALLPTLHHPIQHPTV